MMLSRVETEGKTIQDAVDEALRQMGVQRAEVDIEILREEKMGLFGMLGALTAKVRVTKKEQSEE